MLGHQARVGKDTLANELEAKDGFKRIAFADKLKEVCMDLYNLSYDQMYGDLKNEVDTRFNKTPRQILQYVGQSLFGVDPAVWVKYACKKALESDRVVFTDFRFVHEVNAVKDYFKDNQDVKVVTIKITRNGIGDFTGKEDRSEIELLEYNWDYIVSNNESIDDLYNKGKEICSLY